jgi:uncharacterized membrane protein YfcA
VISALDAALLLGAGLLAGVVGTAGGITSLVSYPALLAVGLGARAASVTNIVALVACWPGSAITSRPELSGKGPWLRRWAVVAVAGALVGSGLLLWTSAGAFSDVVPYLVVFASLSLLVQPRLSRWQERHRLSGSKLLWPAGLLCASAHNGYFGAGSGVMVLVLVMLTAERHLARANALKNMLVGVATVVSALSLVVLGHVDWMAAAPLALGGFLGGTVGPVVARHVPAGALRFLVALTGLGLAARLWIAPV